MAVFAHAYGIQSKLDTFPDLFTFNPHVFRPERDVVFHDRSDRLIVGILEYDPHLFANVKKFVFVRRVQAHDGNFTRVWR